MTRLMTMLGIVGMCSVAALSAQTPAPAAKPAAEAKKEMTATAQKAEKPAKAMAAPAASTVTGCVAEGAGAKHYTLTAEDKTVYELAGGTLKPHVGHKVEVTGATHKAAAAGGHDVLKVKSVKMVAATC